VNSVISSNRPGSNTYWVGGTCTSCAAGGGNWIWDHGESWSYTNWASGEPNFLSNAESALQMLSDGSWNDALPSINSLYVCETLPLGMIYKYIYSNVLVHTLIQILLIPNYKTIFSDDQNWFLVNNLFYIQLI
jgi:hypothetical protein